MSAGLPESLICASTAISNPAISTFSFNNQVPKSKSDWNSQKVKYSRLLDQIFRIRRSSCRLFQLDVKFQVNIVRVIVR
jgi:hypothetical protein